MTHSDWNKAAEETKKPKTSGYVLVALNSRGEERSWARVEYFNCEDLARLLLEWHLADHTRKLSIRPDYKDSEQ